MRQTARTCRFLVLAPALFALIGCDTIGNPIDVMSSKKPSPDEFQVVARKELRRPPALGSSTLPEPTPGAPSPLDPDPQADAIAALTGQRVAASAPRATSISRGEAALLAAANAEAADPDIRSEIVAENAEIEDNKPYEPPTIFEVFSGGTAYDPEDVVDPNAESKRLQESGVPAPVNRTALAAEAAQANATDAAAAEADAEASVPRQPRFRPSTPLDSSFQ